jgi:hypothetical protein
VQKFDPLSDAGVAVEGAGSLDMTVALGLAAMAADAESWSVELLTAAEKKRREWKSRHLFTAAALVVVVAYLGLYAWKCGERFDAATLQSSRIQGESRKRSGNASLLDQLFTERAELAARVDQLEKRKAAGDGVVRALGLLATQLPDDLWATGFELQLQEQKGTAKERVAKKPVIVVDGAGKSRGTRAVDESYGAFIESVRALDALAPWKPADILERQSMRGGQIEYRLEMTWLAEPKAPAAEEEGR